MDSRLEKVTENNKVFLVYKINNEDSIDQMSLNMLKNNSIKHILHVSFTQIGEEQYIRYDITSKISLSQIIKYPISKERFLAIYEGIFKAILNLDDYMVPNNTLLLDVDDIYFDEFHECVYLIALPINAPVTKSIDFAEFTRSLTNRVQLQEKDVFIIGKVLNHLNQTQTFSVVEFKKFIQSMINEKSQSGSQTTVQQQVQQPVHKPIQQPVQPVHQTIPQQQNPTMQAHLLSNQQGFSEQRAHQKQFAQKPMPPQQKNMNIPNQQGRVMNIPGQKPVNKVQQNPVNNTPSKDEPKISLFYLLQHYNAENAALYKKQKAEKREKIKKQINTNIPQNTSARQVPNQVQQQYKPQPVVNVAQREPQKRNFGDTTVLNAPRRPSNNYGETTVLMNGNGAGETTVLTAANNPMIVPYLIRKKNNEKILLNKPVFRIGKERSYVDYFIGDNTAISRSHADFIARDGEYYVEDTNSTNHTFVNGKMIQSGVKTIISHGDTIRLANEDFEFRVY